MFTRRCAVYYDSHGAVSRGRNAFAESAQIKPKSGGADAHQGAGKWQDDPCCLPRS